MSQQKKTAKHIENELGFHGDVELENGKMSGIYVLMPGIVCAYSVYDQTIKNPTGSPPPYVVRGSVRLLDSAGHIFKSQAKTTSTNAPPRTADVSNQTDGTASKPFRSSQFHEQKKSVNINSRDGKVICDAIAEKARALIEENASYLFSEVEKVKPVSEMCLALLFRQHLNRYLSNLVERGIAASADAQHTRELLIKKIASSEIGFRPLGEIAEKNLKQLSKEIGKNWRSYFKETAEFTKYVYLRKRDANPKNAFGDYLETHPEKKQMNAKRLQKNAADSDILISEMDRKFLEDVKANIGDGGMMGAAIVRSTGFNSQLSCNLKWEQVKWLDEEHSQALIRFNQPDKAGRVQNYSFLLSPLWSSVFRLREQWLIEHGYHGENAPVYVASAVKDPTKKLQPKDLTVVCRELAHRYGVSYATLAGLKELEKGAGIRVFQETRKYSLEEAGMKNDPGLLQFYLHESLVNSTQANHYRSLSGELAQHMASVYLARADLLLTDAVPNENRITRTPYENGEIVTVRSPDSHSKVQGTVTLHLKKGDIVRFSGTNGVRIRAKAIPEAESDKM